MRVIADLHIHGKYSRATSKALDFENLEKYAKLKGLNLLGTGDFTHPEWIKEIKTITRYLKNADEDEIAKSAIKLKKKWQTLELVPEPSKKK